MSSNETSEEGEGSFDEESTKGSESAGDNEVVDNPLTKEMAASCLSLLKRLGYGFSHAFIKFDCINKKITDIEILEKFQFLRFVTLSHNYISDLTPLFSAEYLMYLKADYNCIVVPGTNKNLQYLQFMDLAYNKLKSTDYINHCRLKHLVLSHNEIGTLRGIDGPPLNQFKLRSLETLELRGNKITSTDGLENLSDLKTLYCSENLLRNVGDLSRLQGLVTLHLRDNRIRRLDGFLQGPLNLQYLNLRGNLIKRWAEAEKLSFLPSLKILILSDNPIADRDNYRYIILGMVNHLQRLDKENATVDEISESLEFINRMDRRYISEDVEEENLGDEGMISEGKNMDEGNKLAEQIMPEGGNAETAIVNEEPSEEEAEDENED
ncbi:hypothetical protein Aperf_G00000080926 [Anoplocephala perfoliata]